MKDPQEPREGAVAYSALCDAMESSLVAVECTFVRGFAGLHLISHVAEVCRTGIERARSALEHIGINIPDRRIVVSFSPAEIKKDGSQFDLAFAVSIAMLLSPQKTWLEPEKWLFAAELSLSGQLKPVRNIVSFTLTAISSGMKGVVIARENLNEVAEVIRVGGPSLREVAVVAFSSLGEVCAWLFKGSIVKPEFDQGLVASPLLSLGAREPSQDESPEKLTFDDMDLSEELQLTAMVVAAGLHSLLLYGPPGTGKSMFASRVTSIFPLMDERIHLEALRIHSSVAQTLNPSLLRGVPPFRCPHHQASAPAIMGVPEQAGEISLAHGGVLFLDELPEFRRDIIEALREPLEIGKVKVSRAKRKVVWNSHITLVAACNPCPCGWFGSSLRSCSCPLSKVIAYRRKISGPILDRIDVHINMPERSGKKSRLFAGSATKKLLSVSMEETVKNARERALHRNKSFGICYNRDLAISHLLPSSGVREEVFHEWVDSLFPASTSNRGVVKALRVARTIADLADRGEITRSDIEQAIGWQADTAARARGEQALGLCV